MEQLFIVITGPTGVGKTDFALQLAALLPYCVEIINADMGQFYKPLSIGTAKPPLAGTLVPHHLFDIISTPNNFTVMEFRKAAIALMHRLWSNGKLPVFVGGSGFYIKSLFFEPWPTYTKAASLPAAASTVLPACRSSNDCIRRSPWAKMEGWSDGAPLGAKAEAESVGRVADLFEKVLSKTDSGRLEHKSTQELWDELAALDPERAQKIHPNDRYRIGRALEIWYTLGIRPSECKPICNPPGKAFIYCITREREELYRKINERVKSMMEQGWVQEVKQLDAEWWDFLEHKNLLGYKEIIALIKKQITEHEAEEKIAQLTRAYAKRQRTFWRHLKRELEACDPTHKYIQEIEEINLTFLSADLYLEKLRKRLTHFCNL